MKVFLLILVMAPIPVYGQAVLHGCPAKNFQHCPDCPAPYTIFPDGDVQFISRADDDMRGAYGGQPRSEILGEHRAAEGDVFQYQFVATVPPTESDGPYEVWKLKQSGHSATIAVEIRDGSAYIKHRYIDPNGTLHGPTMAWRKIPWNGRMYWDIRIKLSKRPDGYIQVWNSDTIVAQWRGITMFGDTEVLALKYGIRGSFKGPEAIRIVVFEDCSIMRVTS